MDMYNVIGTELTDTNYADLSDYIFKRSKEDSSLSVDFTNVHIVTMRRCDSSFREMTASVNLFVPDSMPLTWCVRAKGGKMTDRVYGPSFLCEAITRSPPEIKHYFLGANEKCLQLLLEFVRNANPDINIVGWHNGYFSEADEPDMVENIKKLDPDLIWVGLGTPKQQEWINRWETSFSRGVFLAVGFAFDVNAGTKKDAPLWMQKMGLTWIYRLLSEPRRLWWRYLKYNSLFVWYLCVDALRKVIGR